FAQLRDVLATGDPLRLVVIAGDDNGDRGFDLRMQRQRNGVTADGLDRSVERDLIAVDAESGAADQADKIARRDRAEQLTGFRGLAQNGEAVPIELLGDTRCLGLE